ncbi:hypothetical protein FGB62_182g140 [Gracilaria domingensis]|nr:hypothetical protein FGB62_182g140 [Gracilaria domingensis]
MVALYPWYAKICGKAFVAIPVADEAPRSCHSNHSDIKVQSATFLRLHPQSPLGSTVSGLKATPSQDIPTEPHEMICEGPLHGQEREEGRILISRESQRDTQKLIQVGNKDAPVPMTKEQAAKERISFLRESQEDKSRGCARADTGWEHRCSRTCETSQRLGGTRRKSPCQRE